MLVVNLFGAPGAGKSTGAAYIFSKLKMAGINAELVTEFAKDKVWEESKAVFQNQAYIFGKQYFRISRVQGKVDVVITMNVFINRVKPYTPSGRFQTEAESDELSNVMRAFLDDHGIVCAQYDGCKEGYDALASDILRRVKCPCGSYGIK